MEHQDIRPAVEYRISAAMVLFFRIVLLLVAQTKLSERQVRFLPIEEIHAVSSISPAMFRFRFLSLPRS